MSSKPENTPARPALSEPYLPMARYRLGFTARGPITLPPFQSAMWRSVFGLALKNLSNRAVANSAEASLYSYFFETPPPPDASKMRRYEAAPHPYVIAAEPNAEPCVFVEGDLLVIELTLIGRANLWARQAFGAFAEAAETGLGKSRGRAELTEVRQVWADSAPGFAGDVRRLLASAPDDPGFIVESPAIPPMPGAVEAYLLSPLRIVRENRLVGPGAFQPGDLLSALLRRVSMLMTFHASCDLETDFRGLTALARQARMAEASLDFAAQRRWSANKGEIIKMDGLVGRFLLDMRGLEPLWPYLWLGQWTHAGKGAVMGLGAIHLREALDF